MNYFLDRFNVECAKIGKSPNAVAKEIGFSTAAVTGWKTSKPSNRSLHKIAQYFDKPVTYFMYNEEPDSKKLSGPEMDAYFIEQCRLLGVDFDSASPDDVQTLATVVAAFLKKRG